MFVDLSIIITCFNKEEYLNDCFESIRRQTRQPKEIILVHDGCSEPQAHIDAETIILKDNVGVSKARDKGVFNSTGKLLLFVDGDDVLSPDYIEKMVATIFDGADITYPDTYFWGKDPRLTITPDKLTSEFVSNYEKVVIVVSSMMKREVYEKLGGFGEFPVLEDLDFFLRALCNDYTFKKSQTLLWYRQTPTSRNQMSYLKKKEVFKKILSKFNISKDKITLNE